MLVVEDGTGKIDADSYISVEDADKYLSSRGKDNWLIFVPSPIPPIDPPIDPEPPVDPVDPPIDPPVDPPIDPPVDPVNPPVETIENTDPPIDPTDPVDPPVEPPVDPTDPVDPPVEPPVDPVEPPVDVEVDPNLAKKEACLRQATDYIDNHYGNSINGERTNPEQSLLFPQTGFIPKNSKVPFPSNAVPLQIIRATAIVAYLVYVGTDLYVTVPQGSILKRKKVDVIEKEWDTSTYNTRPTFGEVDSLLSSLLPIQASTNQIVSGRILRT